MISSLEESCSRLQKEFGGAFSGRAVRRDGTHQVDATIVVTQSSYALTGTISITEGVNTHTETIAGTRRRGS